MEVSVSFLKSSRSSEETISLIEKTTASSIHVDLMDGDYVLEKNDDLDYFLKLLDNCSKPLEIHLMMKKNLSYAIDYLAILKPRIIFIPLDVPGLLEYIKQIRDYNIKVGLAIHPDTDIKLVSDYITQIQSVLVMSVYPGMGGQKFLEDSVKRISDLKGILFDANVSIGVDGGINGDTVNKVRDYVDYVISGSYVCMSDNYQEQIDKLM